MFKFNPKLFPTIMIVIQIICALGYVQVKDWKKVLYWISGALITISVTY
jgi:hypothetical protein